MNNSSSVLMCQVVFSLSGECKYKEQPTVLAMCLHMYAYLFVRVCPVGDRSYWFFIVVSDWQDISS